MLGWEQWSFQEAAVFTRVHFKTQVTHILSARKTASKWSNNNKKYEVISQIFWTVCMWITQKKKTDKDKAKLSAITAMRYLLSVIEISICRLVITAQGKITVDLFWVNSRKTVTKKFVRNKKKPIKMKKKNLSGDYLFQVFHAIFRNYWLFGICVRRFRNKLIFFFFWLFKFTIAFEWNWDTFYLEVCQLHLGVLPMRPYFSNVPSTQNITGFTRVEDTYFLPGLACEGRSLILNYQYKLTTTA